MVTDEPVLVTKNIYVNSCYCGVELKNIILPASCTFIGVVRQGRIILLSTEDINVCCGDKVIAIAFKSAIVLALKSVLAETLPTSWFSNREYVDVPAVQSNTTS